MNLSHNFITYMLLKNKVANLIFITAIATNVVVM